MKLVEDAVNKAFDNLLSEQQYDSLAQDAYAYKSDDDHGYFAGNHEDGWVFCRLRCDYEFAHDSGLSDEDTVDTMKFLLAGDLNDLIENGDAQSTDFLLREFNGIKVRGNEPLDVDIVGANMFVEPNSKRESESTEITLYVVLAVRWPL